MADPTPAAEHSFGIIPIRYDPGLGRNGSLRPTIENTQVLLILQKTSHPSLPFFWTFPKGHAELEDASPLATALRELKEETGLTLLERNVLYRVTGTKGGFCYGPIGAVKSAHGSHVVPESQAMLANGDGSLMERYINPLKGWIKEVRYWVGVLEGGPEEGEVLVQEKEVADAKWLSWTEATELLSMEGLRIILNEAMDMIKFGESDVV